MADANGIRRVVTLDLGTITPTKDHPDRRPSIPVHAFAIEAQRGIVLVIPGSDNLTLSSSFVEVP
jgi:hypothetical protein